MKKLLLAVAVSVAAGSASAATIYEGNGLTYKINGDLQIQLRQKIGDDKEADVEFDDLEIKNYVSYDLGDDMKAFGRVDFGFKDAANNSVDVEGEEDVALEEAYVGLAFGNTSVSFGKMNLASDEFGIEEAIELGQKEDRFDASETAGDDTIRLDIELENAYIAASYEMEAEGAGSENGEYFDLFASTEFANLTLAAAYQNATPIIGADDYDVWGVSASYDAGFATFAADYSDREDHSDQYNIAAVFKAAKTTKIGIGMTNVESEVGADVTEWYANVTYKFPNQKNVSLFAEIADNDAANTDMGYLAGMRVKF
ncbi:porin [Marinobacterium sediminicola]|uniref:Outer membrane protein (Porin) n=1 Tax=Marinobacterium sediminicola TaxID=518898 RepID=A0ABY1RYJ0_9GAMM|nr:porin [Marinobacterium sediminicola]ULG68099.1 porin [Marinobacterium sediminicola]SMR73389.1 Outer membrane protein (porin) [Marinobacterium sediminicola]